MKVGKMQSGASLQQLHIVANSSVSSGGEGLAALRYAESVALAGGTVMFMSKDVTTKDASEPFGKGSFTRLAVPSRQLLLHELLAQYNFLRTLCRSGEVKLVHLHGMWTPFLAVAALVARQKSIPLVISPHGCLEPWALEYKKNKKKLALMTYQGVVLKTASMFIATAVQELKNIRSLGYRQPIAVVPNGVDIGFSPIRNSPTGLKTILFLSRVHPKKGLLDLVEAWASVRRPGWRIVIAGGDEEGYRTTVEALVRLKGLETDFEFTGFVDGARKQACFDSADIFILPTYSENFGIAIAEALANELPVITTTGAPWHDLVEHRCGWWVNPGVLEISDALNAAMECDPTELRNMGKRGRQLVLDKYSWSNIGSTALAASQWLLDQKLQKPDAVKVFGR